MSVLRGVDLKAEILLQRIGTETLANLFAHYPLRFVTYPELAEIGVLSVDGADTPMAVCVELIWELVRRSGRGMQLCTGTFSDGSGELSVTWLRTLYLRGTLQLSRRIILFGKIQSNGNCLYSQ